MALNLLHKMKSKLHARRNLIVSLHIFLPPIVGSLTFFRVCLTAALQCLSCNNATDKCIFLRTASLFVPVWINTTRSGPSLLFGSILKQRSSHTHKKITHGQSFSSIALLGLWLIYQLAWISSHSWISYNN